MSKEEIDILKRALAREKASRKVAEEILELKSAELWEANQKLARAYSEVESLLSKTDSQLQGVFETIVDAYVVADINGHIIKMNQATVPLLGLKDVNDSCNLMELVKPSEYNLVYLAFNNIYKNGGSITDLLVNITTKDNRDIIVQINASVIYDNGVPIATQGIVRDVTKEKDEEEKLIESEARLATLFLNLEEGVLLEDENGNIKVINNKFCEFFNIDEDPEYLIGQHHSKLNQSISVFFEDSKAFQKDVTTILANKNPILNQEIQTIDGRVFERDFIPVYREGVYKGHLWKYKDYTIRRQYRKSLEAEKFKYSSIISNMNLGLVEVDNDDRIVMANKSFLKMTGYDKKDLVGVKGKDLLPFGKDKKVVEDKSKERKNGVMDSYEVKVKTKKGDVRHWLVSGAPSYNLKSQVNGTIGICFDITEIKNLQLQKENLLSKLKRSNDELQEYAHIVSHDLKSPLRSIDALVQWIKEDNKDKLDEMSLLNIDHIEKTLEKMEQLISDVLEYSSVGSEDKEKTNVNLADLVDGLCQILYIPEHIKVNVVNPLPSVKGDKTKLQQLFQNLMSNAVKFIDKPEGKIEIDVKNERGFYQFSVSDNGIGIEKQYHDKIFKIFHALNKSKDSTGIGLSIVKKIVDLHEGKIWLESEPNKGTTFFFTLKK